MLEKLCPKFDYAKFVVESKKSNYVFYFVV